MPYYIELTQILSAPTDNPPNAPISGKQRYDIYDSNGVWIEGSSTSSLDLAIAFLNDLNHAEANAIIDLDKFGL